MSDVIFIWLGVAYDFSILLYLFVYHIAFAPPLAFMSPFCIPSVLVFHFTTSFISKLGITLLFDFNVCFGICYIHHKLVSVFL